MPENDRQELLRQIAFDEPRDPRFYDKSIPVELQTIVMKATAKSPLERYSTAQELADDLKRFLENRPILACPPTLAQRVAKWSRRHKPLVWSLAAAAVIVLAAIAGLSQVYAQRERGVAKRERTARFAVEQEKQQTARLLKSSYMDKAHMFCEQGEIGRGLLWFAKSMSIAPNAATDLQNASRASLAAWGKRLNSLQTLIQMPKGVRKICLSPNGTHLLAAHADGVTLWDIVTRQPVSSPFTQINDVALVAFNPDGTRIVTGTSDGIARLWDATTHEPIGEPIQHRGKVKVVAFSKDGQTMVTGSQGGTIQRWNAKTGEPIAEPYQYEGISQQNVQAAAFCPDGLRLVITTDVGTHQMWDGDRNEPIGATVYNEATLAVEINPDGTNFATAGFEGTVRLWDATTGKALRAMIHGGTIWDVAFSPDGSRLVSAGSDYAAKIWEVATSNQVGSALWHGDTVRAVAMSVDGGRVVTSTDRGIVRIWNVSTETHLGLPVQHEDSVVATAYCPDGLRMLTERNDQLQLRDAATGKPIGLPFKHSIWIQGMSFSPDGSRLLIQHSKVRRFRTWVAQLRDIASGTRIGDPFFNVYSAVFSPKGSRLVIGNGEGTVQQWDMATMKQVGPALQHQNAVNSIAYSPDGKQMLTGSYDGTTRLWDVSTLQPLDQTLEHPSKIVSVAYSPRGTHIATGSADGTLRLWNRTNLDPVGAPLHHQIDCLLGRVSSQRFAACHVLSSPCQAVGCRHDEANRSTSRSFLLESHGFAQPRWIRSFDIRRVRHGARPLENATRSNRGRC